MVRGQHRASRREVLDALLPGGMSGEVVQWGLTITVFVVASESEKINNPATISHNHVWPRKIGGRRLSQTCRLRNFGTVP